MKRNRTLAIVAVVVLLGFFALRASADKVDFDPQVVGAAEARMWKAYYTKNKMQLGREMLTLQQDQFGLNPMVALGIAEPMAKAASVFSRSRSGYDENVLPSLVEGYKRLASASGRDFDAEAAAKAELSWWVARRTPGEDSVEEVGRRIADLYEVLYGSRNERIEEAGRLRAEAAERRDRESTRGTPNWKAIQKTLVASYALLHAGVNN